MKFTLEQIEEALADNGGFCVSCTPMDTVDKIMAYEQGDMDEQETIDFFQELIDSGLVWQLQGSYGRTAARLIQAGSLRC